MITSVMNLILKTFMSSDLSGCPTEDTHEAFLCWINFPPDSKYHKAK